MAKTKKKKWESHLIYAPSVSSWMDHIPFRRPDLWHTMADRILEKHLKEWYPGAAIELGEEHEFGEKDASKNWSFYYEIVMLPQDWHWHLEDLNDLYGDVIDDADEAFGYEEWKTRLEEYEQSLRNSMTQLSKEEALASLVQIRQELTKEACDSELQWDWVIEREKIVSGIQGELILPNEN